MTCGRCGKKIEHYEFCCWCSGKLCWSCWDSYGHCGHPDADEENKRAAERVAD